MVFGFNTIPLLCVALRRMVDAGITRWWGLLLLAFPINLILILAFKPSRLISTSERNQAIAFLKQGNNEYRNGKFNEAIECYDKAIEINKTFKEAYKNREKAVTQN